MKKYSILEIALGAISFTGFMLSIVTIIFSIEDRIVEYWGSLVLPVVSFTLGYFCLMALLIIISYRVNKLE